MINSLLLDQKKESDNISMPNVPKQKKSVTPLNVQPRNAGGDMMVVGQGYSDNNNNKSQ